jgi:predicted ATP-grasp superfamily ATP-dependent carboligase
MTGINRMSFASTVLVYEFFTGGGCPPGDLAGGLAAEALGMLWALLVDFRSWGAVRTITAFDLRFEERVPGLSRETLPADEIVYALPGEHENVYLSLLKRCDAALVLAPETNGILAKLTAQAVMAGVPLLGSSASAVATAGDKGACSRLFGLAKLPAPRTCITSFANAPQIARQINCPLVIKPLDGVGSEGVCRVDRLSDLPAFLAMVRQVTCHERILLQSFISGVHASVSLLVADGRCLPLSLNCQLIETGSPFRYWGSQVPFHHPAAENALGLARSAVNLIPGLNGYVGVDMVLKDDSAQLVEINPRLTTSYIGLRQIAQANLARAIWEACREGILPDRIPLAGQVVIKKDDPGSWNLSAGKSS